MFRVIKHKRYLNSYISQLHLDTVNLTLTAGRCGWDDSYKDKLLQTASLIRKYERRLRLLNY